MKRRYPILGMSCAACAATVQRTLSGTAGVRSAAVNFADGSAMVDFDEAAVEEAVLEQMVRAAGYELVLPDGEASAQQREERAYRLLKRRTVFALVAAAVIMGLIEVMTYRGNILYVTNKRAIQLVMNSLVSSSRNVIDLASVEDVSYRQDGLMQKMFHFGTLRLATVGDETTYTFKYSDISHENLEGISKLVSEAKKKAKKEAEAE